MKDTDWKNIIDKCLTGDRKAQLELFQITSSELLVTCLRYAKTRSDAEDLVQESFAKIFNNLHTYKYKGNFQGWMKRITINTAIDYLKRRNVFDPNVSVDINEIRTIEDRKYSDINELNDLLNIINFLPERRKTVFSLKEIEGYSYKEIAKMLSITVGGARAISSEAKKQLQEICKKLNIEFE